MRLYFPASLCRPALVAGWCSLRTPRPAAWCRLTTRARPSRARILPSTCTQRRRRTGNRDARMAQGWGTGGTDRAYDRRPPRRDFGASSGASFDSSTLRDRARRRTASTSSAPNVYEAVVRVVHTVAEACAMVQNTHFRDLKSPESSRPTT